jgi:anti-sigma factor RsiW
MSISIPGSITLEEVIPLVDRLSDMEREALRQFIESKSHIDWSVEWDKVVAQFHRAFERFSEEEVEADLDRALSEVRSGRSD